MRNHKRNPKFVIYILTQKTLPVLTNPPPPGVEVFSPLPAIANPPPYQKWQCSVDNMKVSPKLEELTWFI